MAIENSTGPHIFPIGMVIEPWGKIAAVALLSGERYYFLVKDSDVSMIPGHVLHAEAIK